MKTKATFEKLEFDFWDMSELKEHFENGELYYKSCNQYFRLKDKSDLSLSAIVGSVYKRVEKELTLRDEERELDNEVIRLWVPVRENGNGKVIIFHNERSIEVDFNTIHALSEILKRHEK